MEIVSDFSDYRVQALPPQYQEAREIDAILHDPRLQERTYDEVVLEIRRVEDGYLVVTERATIQVRVHYLPPDCCGPAKFELEFLPY